MKILIVIPAHNEAEAIALVVSTTKSLGYDVLVVDDGSVDATANQAKSAGGTVLSTGRKSGKGTALRLGFKHALSNGYDAVIALDGDGQHDPNDIKSFIEVYEKTKAAIINGNRMANPTGMPLVRLLTNKGMSVIISAMCRQSIPDTQCGFRFITTDVLKAITLECTDFEIETELLIKASRRGFKIAAAPIVTIYRNEVSKIHPVKDTFRFIRFICKMMAAP